MKHAIHSGYRMYNAISLCFLKYHGVLRRNHHLSGIAFCVIPAHLYKGLLSGLISIS